MKLGFDNFDDDTYGESLFLKTKMKNTNRIPPPPPGVLPTIDERESKTVEEVIQSTRSTIRENESVNTSKNRKYEIALAGVPVDLRLLNRAETLFNKFECCTHCLIHFNSKYRNPLTRQLIHTLPPPSPPSFSPGIPLV